MQRWTQIFKALANDKRIEIIKFLSGAGEKHVTDISAHVHVTIQGTSRHLRLLNNLYILDEVGKDGHVFYSLNQKMPADARKALDLILKTR